MKTTFAGTATVFFDGACPICRREIAFYRRQRGAGDIAWVDVSQVAADEVLPGLSRQTALGRFHVLDETGVLKTGGQAFATLWSQLPAFRWLGRLFRLWPLAWLLERGYRLFLTVRPHLQRQIYSKPGS